MNEPTIRLETRPEVSAFVDKVRARLSDLSDEEREELVGGLEADIAELVADGGSVAELGDPRAYADELRAAAGVERAGSRSIAGVQVRRPRRPLKHRLDETMDASRARWLGLMARPRLAPAWDVATAIRPVWWVLRAWVAVQFLDWTFGPWEYLTPVPTLGGTLGGLVVLLGAVVVSVQLGRGRIWPTSTPERPTWVRAGLVGLNALAVFLLVVVLAQFPGSNAWAGDRAAYNYYDADFRRQPGLKVNGRMVRQVFAYDAQGNPLTGVQLFDGRGDPLEIHPDYAFLEEGRPGQQVGYAWVNGKQQQHNVFPLAYRTQRRWSQVEGAWTSDNPPVVPPHPLAVVPPVALPGQSADPTDETDEAAGADSTAGETEDGVAEGAQRDSQKPAGR
jgi:hypothetical protein